MVPLQTGDELFGSYSEALTVYLSRKQPPDLLEARALGQEALNRGVGVSELCGMHQEVVARVLPGLHDPNRTPDEDTPPALLGGHEDVLAALDAASAFLAESMTPFDADHHDVRRSNSALRHYNQKLENELYRLTRAVYDEALQLLAAARMAMADLVGELKPSQSDRSTEIEGLLDQVHDHLAACCTGLLPRVLVDLGLKSAIESLCRGLSKTASFNLMLESAIDPLPGETGIAIYRTVLEALSNIQQHAKATRVTLRLYRERHLVHCCISDNGVGFDPSPVLQRAHERGSGLAIAAELLRSAGARLTVESVPAAGTTLRISIGGMDATC